MSAEIEERLKTLGIELPSAPKPVANYVPSVISGKLIFISGQVSRASDELKFVGKIGREFNVEQGQQAARICGINILANLSDSLGGLDKVARIVKLTGFVNSVPDFSEPQLVINGASDIIVGVLGEKGRHARSAVGVATLPNGFAVEVEAIAEVA